ncbi:hypothetical protein [Actinomycetospora corticicola]|uniref:Uncharacterized protein n=1 Tax=Actinomycetospora corticicola TaxID=663602 RepID=A0A7Y9J954_9PSEU|nr:hypothetical protein [Actinomycetospora corticicola]NYD39801.1 hypothetical protein [Actinomycetospora corticicola]
MLAAVDDRHGEEWFEPGRLPSTWLVDVATAELAVEMVHDTVTTGRDVDIDLIVDRAARTIGSKLD